MLHRPVTTLVEYTYVTGGIAVVGASVVSVASMPIQASDLALGQSDRPAGPVQQPALRLVANTSDVLVTWEDLFRNTAANLDNLGQKSAASPRASRHRR